MVLDNLSTKELLMLYSFILESLYLATHPEVERTTRLVLSRHDLILTNMQRKTEGKKPSRLLVLKNSEATKTITFADMHLLRLEVERRLFQGNVESVEWDGGDHAIVIKPVESGIRLELLSENPVALTFSAPEVLKLLSTNLSAIPVWDAPYPLKTDRLEIVHTPKVFALLRLKLNEEVREYQLGRYPLITLAWMAQRALN